MTAPHHGSQLSGWQVTGVPVLVVTSAVLCQECLGDWCDACDHTGLAWPAEPPAVVGGGSAPTAGPLPLVAAVDRWCTDVLAPREAA